MRKEGMYASHHPVRDETDSSTYTTTEEEQEGRKEKGRSGSDICVQSSIQYNQYKVPQLDATFLFMLEIFEGALK